MLIYIIHQVDAMYADIKKYPNLGFLNKNLWKIFLGIKLWIFFSFFVTNRQDGKTDI